jgi:hypothetical protein
VQEGLNVGFQANPDHPDYEAFRAEQGKLPTVFPPCFLNGAPRSLRSSRRTTPSTRSSVSGSCTGESKPKTLQPAVGDGLTATSEYVAHVLLDRSTAEPTREATPDELRRGVDPIDIGQRVAEIMGFLPVLYTHRQHDPDADQLDPWLELRSRLYMHRLFVRSFTFEAQETETLRQLFGGFDEELRRLRGFTVDEGLKLATAIGPSRCEALRCAPSKHG